MPFIDEPTSAPQSRAPTGVTPPNPMRPTDLDTLVAAFRQENPIVSVARTLSEEFYQPEDGHNPLHYLTGLQTIEGRGADYIERHLDRFIGSRSEAETSAIMRRIDEEEASNRTLDAAGFAGTVAQVGAGLLDPTIALPGGAIVKSAKGGYSLIRSAASIGAAGAGAAAITEGVLQSTHETRSALESTTAIASAAILSGLIGAGAARLLSKVERSILERGLDRDRAAIDTHAGNAPERITAAAVKVDGKVYTGEIHATALETAAQKLGIPVSEIDVGRIDQNWFVTSTGRLVSREAALDIASQADQLAEGTMAIRQLTAEDLARVPESTGLPASAGAAAADTRVLELAPSGLGFTSIISTTRRVLSSASVQARRIVADAFETPYRFEGGEGPNGPALDRLARMEINGARVEVSDGLERLFSQYRFSKEDAGLVDWTRARFEDLTGGAPGKMSYAEFKAEVSRALIEGDTHAIPQVEQAAQLIRRRVFEPWKQRAIEAGALPEGVDVKTAASYFQRVYNKERIRAERPAFVNKVQDWLKSDQITKAAAKERIQAYRNALDVHEETADLISARIETRTARLEDTEARQEEVTRFNRFAFQRSQQLSEPLDALRGRIRTIEGTIEPHLQRLEELRNDIRAEKEQFPEIREADSLIFRMIGASQRLREAREAIDTVEAAAEYVAALNETIEGFRGGIREASAAARLARRDLGADTLVAMERAQTAVRREVAPFLRELRRVRRELREEHRARSGVARGGAVFETQIRNRGNTLANRASGQAAEIETLEIALAREIQGAADARARIEAEIAAWEGKSVGEAKTAMRAREAYEAERQARAAATGAEAPTSRLTAADDAIDRAVRRILDSDRELPDEDLRARAHEITDRILGSPDGRLPYDIPMGGPEIGWRGEGGEPPRGPLAARQFNIPDAVIRDFLEDDVETVVAMHLRTIVPDVMLIERFGDVRMTEAFKKINEEYARLSDAATSNKERARLENERQAVTRDIAAMRDRMRGVFGWSADTRNMARVAAGAKVVNNLTSMGVAAISSLPDFAGAVFRWGFQNAFRDGWEPYFRYLAGNNEGWDQFKRQMRAVGIGIDVATNARQNALDDVTDVYRPGSRFERALQSVNDKFFIANLLSPLTDVQKTIAAHVSVSEILRAAKAAAEGKATKKQLANLTESGIDQQMAGKIWAEFQRAGEVVDGVHLPNTADWARDAADALNGAVSREVDIAVVTPGQEKPLWMSRPVASLLGQFKSFTAAATERVLVANLMRRDAHALSGLIMAVGLGMLSYKLNSFFGGQKTSDRPQDWIKEGISRSGVTGWFEEGNALASKMTRGGVDVYRMIGADKPLSRFASRSTLDMLLGPTAAKIEGLSKVTGAAAARDWTAADTTALRRLMAFQNLFYLRGAINQAEGGFNEMLGVPPRAEPENRR